MNEQARRRLHDARDACDRIEWETLGFAESVYVEVSTVRYAVNWLLMTLGEALTVAVREHPDPERRIPDARAAIGLRNRIVHGYDAVGDALIREERCRGRHGQAAGEGGVPGAGAAIRGLSGSIPGDYNRAGSH
jgi:uncharacterized protein with HEPN domain